MAWRLRFCGSGVALAATAPFPPLAWQPPYATGATLEKAKRPKEKKRKGNLQTPNIPPNFIFCFYFLLVLLRYN